jgi:hypothetical protein
MSALKHRTLKICAVKDGSFQVCVTKSYPLHIDTPQICSLQLRTIKDCPFQMCASEYGYLQLGAAKNCSLQMRNTKDGLGEVRVPQDCSS